MLIKLKCKIDAEHRKYVSILEVIRVTNCKWIFKMAILHDTATFILIISPLMNKALCFSAMLKISYCASYIACAFPAILKSTQLMSKISHVWLLITLRGDPFKIFIVTVTFLKQGMHTVNLNIGLLYILYFHLTHRKRNTFL